MATKTYQSIHTGEFIDEQISAVSQKLPIDGTAVAAEKLATPRIISLTGDVIGSGSFDGNDNLSITTTVADDSHEHTNYWKLNGTGIAIEESTDLNTLTTAGVYQAADSTVAASLSNCPHTSTGFKLIIQDGYISGCVNQLLFSNSNVIYTRMYNNSNWTAWANLWKSGDSVTGAVWNDYAECRESDCEEFGYVLMENGDDTLSKTIERLSHFAGVSSDTWGFNQGETDKAKTPIAVAGRVLVYPYQDRNNYKPGDCVCAAPGGTVDIMTREEVREWPDRIVGIVSCVPEYEIWGGGQDADRSPVSINGRIWIKVK